MANETPRMKITYPALGEANYFDNYQAGMNDIDANIFAAWSAINTIPSGGGTLTWSLVGSDYTLTWTDAIAFQTPAFGSAQSVAAGSIIIPKGLLIYTDLAFGATVASTGLTFTVASQVPVDTASLAFAWHNPVTDQLHFATGLVIALNGSATGIQPQGGGGGGGSITVTDGSVTVNPTTTITVNGGFASVSDLGGGNAEIYVPTPPSLSVTDGTTTVNPTTSIEFYNEGGFFITDEGGGAAKVGTSLITRFVVDGNGQGTSEYSTIQDAIDAADAWRTFTGQDQIVYIRPMGDFGGGGAYKEDLEIPTGISLVGLVEQQRMVPTQQFPAPLYDDPITNVIIDCNSTAHTFVKKSPARSSIQNLVFRGKTLGGNQSVFYVGDLDDQPSSIEFRNCRFEHKEDSVFFVQDTAEKNYGLSVSFTDCSFYVDNAAETDVFLLGSGSDWDDNAHRSSYTFNRCYFLNTSGNGVDHWLRLNYGYNALTLLDCRSVGFKFDVALFKATVVVERCFFDNSNAGLAKGYVFDDSKFYSQGDLFIKECEFITDGAVAYFATWGNGYSINDWASTYAGIDSSSEPYPFDAGYISYGASGYKATPASYAGDTLSVNSGSTYYVPTNVTTVLVDTSVGGLTTLNLPIPAYCMNQTVSVYDSGGSAGSAGRNITVACPSSSVVGPHQVLNHNYQVTTFKAMGGIWKSISALW